MGKFYGTVMLYINTFEAEDYDKAEDKMNYFIDLLAKTGGELRWEDVENFVYEEKEGGN